MNLNELDRYKLSDAVKFNARLNPRLWGKDEHLTPKVREALMKIADDFRESLGVNDLDLKDITVSGSNAAYTYTPNSDIDLHLVVNVPQDEVYRELFDAKKYAYNNQHNIRIGGYDVELYVQDADKPVVSQGEYSLLNNDWIQVPRRQRADVVDRSTRSKYQDLKQRIKDAVKTKDHKVMATLMTKIKQLRQSGLDEHGEFGPENLAFKMLRTQGYIQRLVDARNAAKDQELSIDERVQPHVTYGFTTESEDGLQDTINQFAKSCIEYLGINKAPKLELHTNTDWSEQTGSFGQYDPETNVLHLATSGRHTLDILRTMAHEFTHRKQAEKETLPPDAGVTGSKWEDEANAMAGRIMRHWAEKHPEMFAHVPLEEASGYIPTKKQANDPRFVMALTRDVRPGAVGKEANKLGLQTDAQGHPALLTTKLNESLAVEDDQYGNQDPTGPESPPQMPAGTIKVDVSDIYDWYKIGQKISDLKSIDKKTLGKGPPSTVLAFGSEELENMYSNALINLGLKTHDLDEPGEEDRPGSGQDIDEDLHDMPFDGRKSNEGSKQMRVQQIIEVTERVTTLGGFPAKVLHVEHGATDEALKLDAPQQSWSKQDMQDYLSRIKTGTKTKQDRFKPIIHGSNVKAITKDDGGDEWDLDDLKRQITQPPRQILGTNAKMAKSKQEGAITYDLTLPALSGIVVDEETGDFVEVITCPGAGECQTYCYARKGGYVMFPASSMSAAQALNFLVNHPSDYMAMFDGEIKKAAALAAKNGIKLLVRIHDAGDFFSKEYYNLMMDVARNNPNVKFYFYTKMGQIVTDPTAPANVIKQFSPGAKSREVKTVQVHRNAGNHVKDAITLPKDMFRNLFVTDAKGKYVKDEKGRTQVKSDQEWQQFRQDLGAKYNIDPDTVITYDEMNRIPEGPAPKWNVVVFPAGHGDLGASRLDVANQFLMFH